MSVGRRGMEHYLYVIRSGESQYIGVTKDIEDRLKRHNMGHSKSTKHQKNWKLAYFKKYTTICEARREEVRLKRVGKKFVGDMGQKFCTIGA